MLRVAVLIALVAVAAASPVPVKFLPRDNATEPVHEPHVNGSKAAMGSYLQILSGDNP